MEILRRLFLSKGRGREREKRLSFWERGSQVQSLHSPAGQYLHFSFCPDQSRGGHRDSSLVCGPFASSSLPDLVLVSAFSPPHTHTHPASPCSLNFPSFPHPQRSLPTLFPDLRTKCDLRELELQLGSLWGGGARFISCRQLACFSSVCFLILFSFLFDAIMCACDSWGMGYEITLWSGFSPPFRGFQGIFSRR